ALPAPLPPPPLPKMAAPPPPPFPGRFAPPFRSFPPGPFPPAPPPAPSASFSGRPLPFPAVSAAPPPFLLPPEAAPYFPAPRPAAAPPLFPPWPSSERPPAGRGAPPGAAEAEEEAQQRQRDEQWLTQFLARHRAPFTASSYLLRCPPVPAPRPALRRLEAEGDEEGWSEVKLEAEAARSELQEAVRPLREPGYLQELGRKAEKARKRRRPRRRRPPELPEREAEIDRWRAKCIQEVEEKNRERELKAAADSVLSEVRKKQADTKRMMDILRALEKLRKLRKEAVFVQPPSADEAFESQVESLKTLLKNRTELYEAEERALRVMLEGEQEEERKREMEKKQKKEREKLLQQKREIDSKLFGDPDEFPLADLLQPFREYYLQAEHSVAALIQIRHEWDQYLVPADHPEGSCIPPGWVLPSLPTNDTWATAVR
uniref:Programmed cell death 7 n=1 Tax=Anas platyrhynchos TaxID=8839 RepID=A0A8B9TFX0_ANAPL